MNATADERLVVMLEARITEFEKRMRKAENTGSDSYRRLRKGSQSATRGMEQDMIQSTNRINQAMAATSSKIGTFGKAFLGGLVAGGAIALIAESTRSVRRFAGEIATVGDEAKRAGMSAKAFQEWKFVAEQNRIGVDALVDGFKELNLRADEFVITGGGSAAEAFQRLGYSAGELQEKLKDPSALMLEIIGRMGQLDKASQIRISDELFGGSAGERFVELLDQGEDGIRKTITAANDLGIIMDDELIAKAADIDRKFNAISQTVGVTLKSAIVSAAASLGDFLDGFREFQDQKDSTLANRQSDLMRRRVEITEGRKNGRFDVFGLREGGEDVELAEIDKQEALIIAERAKRETLKWQPKTDDTWVAPTPTGAIVPDKKGAKGKAGAGAKRDEFAAAVAGIREQTRALEEQARAFEEVEASGRDYSDAVDYAQTRADLLVAAHKAGLAITPELIAQIDQLAEAYTLAGQEAERAADRMQQIEGNGKRGADAVAGIFMAATEGADAAKQAVAQLLAQMAQAQTMKAFASLAGMGGTTGSIFSTLGSMMSFDGGGYTGNGGRSGGLDGKGGFMAMLHPRETVTDHTKPSGSTAGGSQRQQLVANVNINLEGASGDDHIRRLAREGTEAGMAQIMEALPSMIHEVNDGNPWRRN